MKQLATALLVGFALGAGACYLVLRHATAEFETRATAAEAAAAILDSLADQSLARADSARAVADSIRAMPRPERVVTRIQRVAVAAESLPDTCRPALDSAFVIIADLQGAVFDSGQGIEANEAEVTMLRAALELKRAARDTVGNALADRPSAVVTWDWKPKLRGDLTVRYETNGTTCAELGPKISLWRLSARGYVAGCTFQVANGPMEVEPRAGVAVSVRVF